MTRLCVVGAGWFGRKHCLALTGLEEVELVGVTDLDATRAMKVAEEGGTTAYPDLAAMLEHARPEIVTIATPESHHVEPALTALHAGCHVFVEKPLATSSRDAERIVEAARVADRRLLVGHLLRFDEAHVQLVERVKAGALGELRHVYARRNVSRGTLARAQHAHPAHTLLPHDLDLIRWLLNADPMRVTGHQLAAEEGRVLVAVLEYASALAVVEACWLLPDGAPLDDSLALEVIGTKGSASLRAPSTAMQVVTDHGVELVDTSYWPESDGHLRGALRDELGYAVGCIARGIPADRLQIADALAAVSTLERILESAGRLRR